MKFLFALLCIAVLRPATSVLARSSSAAPADTVAGHARMVRQLSETMCRQLSSDHTTSFAAMSSPAALQMTQELFVTAMKRDSVAFIALMATATEQGVSAQAVGQAVGKDVVVRLSQTCPAALPLIVRLTQTEQAKQAMANTVPDVSEAEKKVLQPLVTHLCAQLAAADARQPFAKRTAAQRGEVFTQLMQKEFVGGRPQLLKYYSAAQLNEVPRREEIGRKMAALMLAQSSCAGYLLLMGADEISKQKP